MKNQDFKCSITANVTAKHAVDEISKVSAWWGKTVEGSSQKLNDVFTVRFGTTWVTFKITEFTADSKIVWTVTDCYLPWLEDKTEWNGTKVMFEISSKDGITTINFTHQGLVPEVECYDNCVKGWTGHVTGSLQNLLNTGIGQPQ
jgi:hypothetical protein